MLKKIKSLFGSQSKTIPPSSSSEVRSQPVSDDLFAAMENEVSDEDLEEQRRQLERADRIGKYSKWICMIVGIVTGAWLANLNAASPWAKIPGIGLVYDMLFGDPVKTFIAMLIGAAIGWLVAMLIAKGIYSGARQDERNKRKLQD